jgi:hypothetical protein
LLGWLSPFGTATEAGVVGPRWCDRGRSVDGGASLAETGAAGAENRGNRDRTADLTAVIDSANMYVHTLAPTRFVGYGVGATVSVGKVAVRTWDPERWGATGRASGVGVEGRRASVSNSATESGLRRGRRWLTVFAVLALGATLLAACGDNDNKEKTPTAGATTAPTTAPAASPAKGGSPAASPAKGGSPTAGGTPKATPTS